MQSFTDLPPLLISLAGIRDPRYTLVHHSAADFSVRLSNVTVRDEGVYTCLHYMVPTGRKQVNVNVLGEPPGFQWMTQWWEGWCQSGTSNSCWAGAMNSLSIPGSKTGAENQRLHLHFQRCQSCWLIPVHFAWTGFHLFDKKCMPLDCSETSLQGILILSVKKQLKTSKATWN